MKKYMLIVLTMILTFSLSTVTAFASTDTENDNILTNKKPIEVENETELYGFIPDGYNFYFCHQWEANNDYYIGFYSSIPIMTKTIHPESGGSFYHITESDGSNPLYYRFSSYEDMISYLILNDASDVSYVYERNYISYMRLNLTNDLMFYSNFDICFSDGTSYFEKNAYTELTTEIVMSDETYIVDSFDNDFVFSEIVEEILSLVPMVIVVCIGLLALRKAISFLFAVVRSA